MSFSFKTIESLWVLCECAHFLQNVLHSEILVSIWDVNITSILHHIRVVSLIHLLRLRIITREHLWVLSEWIHILHLSHEVYLRSIHGVVVHWRLLHTWLKWHVSGGCRCEVHVCLIGSIEVILWNLGEPFSNKGVRGRVKSFCFFLLLLRVLILLIVVCRLLLICINIKA